MDYFKEVLQTAGICLKNNEQPNILSQEQALVIRDLENELKNSHNHPDNIDEFVEGMKEYFENETLYLKAFSASTLQKIINDSSGNASHIDIEQESLIKILLNTTAQPQIMRKILDDITNDAPEDQEGASRLRILLNTLKYLPFITEPDILTERLLDILDIASFPAQLEILYLIPEILPDSQNNEIAKQLSKLLISNINLAGAIIDCLNALNLNTAIRNDVQQQIVNNIISSSSSINIFPILFEFLITDCKSHNIENILMKVRDALDKIISSDNESMKVIIAKKIISAAIISKTVSEGWLNLMCHITVDNNHKPIDLLLLFLLHGNIHNKKQFIENIFKKRIKQKLFKISLVESYFKKYLNSELLQDCLSSIIEIAHMLLKNKKEHLFVEFATMLYKCAFLNEHATFIQRQIILQNLILQTGLYSQENVTSVILVFKELLENKIILKMHILKLVELLEKLDKFDLKDVKSVFDIICSIAYFEADESMTNIKNELNILIKKHTSSCKSFVKFRGIVCSIVMAKHVATVDHDQSDVNLEESSMSAICDLQSEAAKEAAALLQSAYFTADNSPVLRGLYYDELASMIIQAEALDKYFLAWLFETITNNFQDVFVTETISGPIDGIQLSSQYCINATDEVETAINVNIAGLSMQLTYQDNNSILILAPIFRLLRLLHSKQNEGDLTSIDALLGCGVVMPVIECIDNFNINQLKKIVDCLFHCVNWFREIISAFVTQKIKSLRQKVLKRLNHLIEVEELLRKCMEYIPEYKLPNSYFYNLTLQSNILGSPKKSETALKPKKRPRLNETEANETTVSQIAPQTQLATSASKKNNNTEIKHIELREIDIDTILLLKYPLGGNTIEETPTQQTNLNLKQFNFLLKDFTFKLYALVKKKNVGLSNLNMVDPNLLIIDCSKLMPFICNHLKIIVNSLNMILEETNEEFDSPLLFTDEARELKIGFITIMEMFLLIYGWSGFHQSKNINLLKDCLKALIQTTPTQISINRSISLFLNKLAEYEKNCLNLQSAVYLIETMKELYNINMNNEYKQKITETSSKMLARRWFNNNGNIDTGRQAFVCLDVILKAYFDGKTTQNLYQVILKAQEEIRLLKTKKDNLPMLPSIDKGSFHIMYRNLCHALLERLKTEILSLANNQHLVLWKTIVQAMQGLVTIAKLQESKSNFISYFKKSHGILKIFLTKGIPILEIMLRSNPNEVIDILKTVQLSTRFLQNLCSHSKLTKDSALIKFVPICKYTLEQIIYRVKAALVANECSSSFWMGNLKNKDLNGEIIASQTTSNSELMDNMEEELPEDETDEEFLEESDNVSMASEIF